MARKKVKLAYIENETARKVTYKKRAQGVIKKTKELSILCDVDACAIIYGPYDPEPMVWPPNHAQARRILKEYKRKPVMDQAQRCFTQQTYLQQSVAKARERLQKMQRRNREMEMELLMVDLLAGRMAIDKVNSTDFPDLLWVIDDKLKAIGHRMALLKENSDSDDDDDTEPHQEHDGGDAAITIDQVAPIGQTDADVGQGGNEAGAGAGDGAENPPPLNEVMGNTQHWDLPSPSAIDWLFLP